MNQPEKILDKGTLVRVHDTLGTTEGMNVNSAYLNARRPGATGEIQMAMPGLGGDVYLVKHEEPEAMAVYSFTEFEADDGTDPTLLRPGRRVKVMITGRTLEYICEVLAEKKYGQHKVRVVEIPEGGSESMKNVVLQCEDYIPRGYVST